MDNGWLKQALCKGRDPKIFYQMDLSSKWYDLPQARVLCGACPVRLQCLDSCISKRFNEDGFWGGSTPTNRRVLKELKPSPEDFNVSVEALASKLVDLDEIVV